MSVKCGEEEENNVYNTYWQQSADKKKGGKIKRKYSTLKTGRKLSFKIAARWKF
jgi:hypothetical protein